MATTYNKTGTAVTSGVPSPSNRPYRGDSRSYCIEGTFDFTSLTTADGSMVTTNIFQCLAIPAETKVSEVHIELITKSVGTALSITVGDAGSPAGWQGTWDITAATAGDWKHSAIGTDARMATADNGYFYDAADTIDVTLGTTTDLTAGPKFRIIAVCYDLSA